MRRFVIGDIHGNYLALVQCMLAVRFDYNEDLLISIGDICDGYPDTYRCVEMLKRVKNFKWCIGNHDLWFMCYLDGSLELEEKDKPGTEANDWYYQGGAATLHSYKTGSAMAIEKHSNFWLWTAQYYHIVDSMAFVHAGIIPGLSLDAHLRTVDGRSTLLWNRELYKKKFRLPNFEITLPEGINKLFIGHTANNYGPFISDQLINVDTGAGWAGRLTIMDIDTLQYWQSDPAPLLYPGYKHDSFI